MNRNSFKWQAVIIILLAFLPVIVVGMVNYVIDPLQVYRKQQWTEPLFWSNQRNQNAGKIKTYLKADQYQAIILGNSVADNFIPSLVEQIFGWGKTIKLTLNGGYPSEISFMLEKALSHHNDIRNVLWVIRPDNFTPNLKERWHKTQKIPFYLYNKNILDDYPYLFSMDMLNKSISLIGGSTNKNKWQSNLDTLNYWQSKRHILKQINYNRPRNLKTLADQIQNRNIIPLDFDCSSNKRYPLSEIIFDFVKNNPDINFRFIIAPKTLHSLNIRTLKKISDYYCFQKFFVLRAHRFENVDIFGFEDVDKIVGNIANYRDPNHYHSGVNKFMLDEIALGQGELNVDNIDDYIHSIILKLNQYHVFSSFSSMIPFAKDEENELIQHLFSKKKVSTSLKKARQEIKKRDYQNALGLLNEVVQSPFSDANMRANSYALRATAYARMGKRETALKNYDAAIDLNLKKAWVYADRGLLRQKQKDLLGAEADFLTAISLAPTYYRGYWFLGNLLSEKGLPEKGIALLTKAIELKPKRSALYGDRAKIFQLVDREHLAQKDFQKMESLKNH